MSPEAALLKKWFPWTSEPLIVGAPMRTVSGPKLTAAVHAAGGLGFLGIGYDLPPLPSTLKATQDLIPPSHLHPTLPFGIGILTWNCSLQTAISLLHSSSPNLPIAIWLFGCRTTSELHEWATTLKHSFPQILLFYQAGSIAEVNSALLLQPPSQKGENDTEAVSQPLIDALILQGTSDAGGHGLQKGASLMTLLPETTDHITHLKRIGSIPQSRTIPILAAGGIIDCRGAAAGLILGAHGIVLGTRLIATPESEAHDRFKELIVNTSDGGQKTIRTRVYDEVRGTGGWPGIYGGRAIVNKTFEEYEDGGDVDGIKDKYAKAVEEEDFTRLTAFAGTGVGLIHDIHPAGDIVNEVREGIKTLFFALQAR